MTLSLTSCELTGAKVTDEDMLHDAWLLIDALKEDIAVLNAVAAKALALLKAHEDGRNSWDQQDELRAALDAIEVRS